MQRFRARRLVGALLLVITAIVIQEPGVAMAKGKPKPPPGNPVLSAISPGSVPALSPALTITLTGSNFQKSDKVTINNSPIATKFKSAKKLTAVIPVGDLRVPETLEVAVSFSGSAGFTSSTPPKPFIVAKNAIITLLAIPNSPGTAGASWQISLNALNAGGTPITGQKVTLHSTHGKFSPAKPTTDSFGTVALTYTPTSTKFTSDALSATIGNKRSYNETGIVLNLPSAPPIKHKKGKGDAELADSEIADPSFSFFNSAVIGVSGAFKQPNPFATANATAQTCVNQFFSSGSISKTCGKPLKGFASAGGGIIQNESCAEISNLPSSDNACINSSGGLSGMDSNCVSAAQGYECKVAMSQVQGVSPSGCEKDIGALEAEVAYFSQDTIAENGQFQIQPDMNTPSQADSYACNIGVAPPPLAQGEQPICPAGQTCFYVADIANSTINVYDHTGKLILAPGTFPDVAQPGGITYDGLNGLIYVTNTEDGNSSITAYDLAGVEQNANQILPSGTVQGQGVSGFQVIDYDPVADLLYVGDINDSLVLIYDPSTGDPVSVPGFATAGIDNPFGVQWNPLTNFVYVSNQDAGALTVYNSIGTQLSTPGGYSCASSNNCSPDNFTFNLTTGGAYAAEASYNNQNAHPCSISGFSSFDLNGVGGIAPSGAFSSVSCPNDVLVQNGDIYVTNLTSGAVTVYNSSGTDITSSAAPGGFSFGTTTNPPAPTGIIAITTPLNG